MPARGETKSVGGKSYEWNGRRWVPESVETTRQPMSTKRSRYSQGAPRPARDPQPAEESSPQERSGRDRRRGSGVRGRGPEQPLSFSPTIRGRSGAQRAKNAATAEPPENTSPTGRDEPRTSPTGVPQTGTRTGPTPMNMEELQQYLGKDVQLANPFLSNALPGTNDDGYSYGDAVAMGVPAAEAATKKQGGFVESTIDGSGTIETKMVQGSPNLVLSGTGSAAPSDVKTNDINDPSTWDENYARRRAFLDADSSMAGLKAVQAQKGIVYAGDKYYMNTGKTGENGNPVLQAIEGPDAKQDVRGYMRGAQGAEDLKNKYIDKIQTSGESLTSPAPENYISTEQSPIAPIESTAQVDASQVTDAPTLIDEVKPEFTDKDRSGRYNIFR